MTKKHRKAIFMTKRRSFLILCVFIICISACINPPTSHFSGYYFSPNILKDTAMYIYHNEQLNEYSIHQKYYVDSSSTIHTRIYGPDFMKQSESVEKVVSNGVILQSKVLYDTSFAYNEDYNDNAKSIKINSPQLFSYDLQDSTETLVYNVEWEVDSNPKHTITMIKNRYCDCTQIGFRRKLNVIGRIEDTRQGTLSILIKGSEIYARDTGLVSYSSTFSNGITMKYDLIAIKMMEEWRKLAQ